MDMPHLALTVIEDPVRDGHFHWLLLRGTGNPKTVEAFEASQDSFESAVLAFDAGSARWKATLSIEDEDADPVGDVVAD